MNENVSSEMLKQFIESAETVIEERKEKSDILKDIYANAKAEGFDTKAMKGVIKLRAMDRAARQEAEALLETYKTAIGLD